MALRNNYFASEDVRVFPTSFRGNYIPSDADQQQAIDPEARLNTEYNYIHSGNASLNKSSFIKKWDAAEKILTCVIGGYYFEIKNIMPLELAGKYLSIKTRAIELKESDNVDGQRETFVLDSWLDGVDILDQQVTSGNEAGKYYFTGIKITNENTGATGSLIAFTDDGNINYNEFLPLVSSGSGYYEEGSEKLVNSIRIGRNTTASGEASFVTGLESEASGLAAVAANYDTKASGNYSVAIGNGTEASYEAAFAEGYQTKAAQKYAHAEGNGTNAGGESAHAEGENTSALGKSSHVEGVDSAVNPNGNGAHAEGYKTIAGASYAHAEGIGDGITISASGEGSHSEGYLTVASGKYAHAEGEATKALQQGSHAEGAETEASGVDSHAEGYKTKASGNNSHAEGCGRDAVEDDASTEANEAVTEKYLIARGKAAHAEGYITEASGDYSHAEGAETTASGVGAHAAGYKTTAAGDYSSATGTATRAEGKYSNALGNNTVASGESSNTAGQYTKASGVASHAEGGCDKAESWEIQDFTEASGKFSHAEGENTKAEGKASHAEGYKTNVTNDYGHAEGKETIASGAASHAEGLKTSAVSEGAHAEGINTIAGKQAEEVDIGQYAHAEGNYTKATGKVSHTEGKNTEADVQEGHAEGSYTKATYKNTEDKYTTSINNLDTDMYARHAEGCATEASAVGAHAEGLSTRASGKGSHASGLNTIASGEQATAIGNTTQALCNNSLATGLGTVATNDNEVVFGKYNKFKKDDENNPVLNEDHRLFVIGNGFDNGEEGITRQNAFEVLERQETKTIRNGIDIKIGGVSIDKIIKDNLIDYLYPIGSIYIHSPDPKNPPKDDIAICPIEASLGGTWERLQGYVLYAAEVDLENADKDNYGICKQKGSKDAIIVEHTHSATTTNVTEKDNITKPITNTAEYNLTGTFGVATGDYARTTVTGDKASNVFTIKSEDKTFWNDPNHYDYNSDHDGTDGYTGNGGYLHENDMMANYWRYPTSVTLNGKHSHDMQHDHTISIDNTGDNGKNANMPPYLCVYMWRRTA